MLVSNVETHCCFGCLAPFSVSLLGGRSGVYEARTGKKNFILQQWSVRWSDINLKFLSIDIIARFTSTQMVHLWWSRLKIDIRSNSQENMHDLTMFWVKNPWSSTSGKNLLFKLRDSPSPGDRRKFFGLWWLQALALATNQDAWHRGWSSWQCSVRLLRMGLCFCFPVRAMCPPIHMLVQEFQSVVNRFWTSHVPLRRVLLRIALRHTTVFRFACEWLVCFCFDLPEWLLNSQIFFHCFRLVAWNLVALDP